MKEITEDQFLQDVRAEVESLKNNATKEEINNLDFDIFNPESQYNCIYGQMTGRCSSERAKELMDLGCVRVAVGDIFAYTKKELPSILKKINGPYNGQMWTDGYRNFNHLSMIETYILLNNSKPKNIIDYLKGKTEKLVL